MFNLMYITNNVELAQYAIKAGVDRIFVDLEIIGKYERQGHKDTLISGHSIEDVKNIRTALPDATLLVRINPLHPGTAAEIERVLIYRPQFVMLPMYRTSQDVDTVSRMIQGRAQLIPLLETAEALHCVDDVCQVEGVSEIYVGLNDLHLSLNLKFMFELLADGTVEKIAKTAQKYNKKFGFGGIARLNEGLLPSEYILSEHARLGSQAVILSRTFHRESQCAEQLQKNIHFMDEIDKVRAYMLEVAKWSESQFLENKNNILRIVKNICAQ